jgi:hypothetical protein
MLEIIVPLLDRKKTVATERRKLDAKVQLMGLIDPECSTC